MSPTPSKLSTPPKTTVFYNDREVIEVGADMLAELRQAAWHDKLGRARLCLHHHTDDKVHEMIIAFRGDSYVRPHRHHDKSESFHVIEGDLMVVFFNDEGTVTRRIRMTGNDREHPFL